MVFLLITKQRVRVVCDSPHVGFVFGSDFPSDSHPQNKIAGEFVLETK